MREVVFSLGRFLRKVLSDLPTSIGSNPLGVLFPALPALLWFIHEWFQPGWQAMKHDILVGVGITLFSYFLLFLYVAARNIYREHRAHADESKKLKAELDWIKNRPLWEGYASEQQWRDSINEQNRLVNIGHAFDGLLSDPQIQAFKIANGLAALLKEFGPRPDIDWKQFSGDRDGMAAGLTSRYKLVAPWLDQLKAKYALNFRTQVEDAYYRFLAHNIKSEELLQLTHGAYSEKDIERIIVELWKLAFLVQHGETDLLGSEHSRIPIWQAVHRAAAFVGNGGEGLADARNAVRQAAIDGFMAIWGLKHVGHRMVSDSEYDDAWVEIPRDFWRDNLIAGYAAVDGELKRNRYPFTLSASIGSRGKEDTYADLRVIERQVEALWPERKQ